MSSGRFTAVVHGTWETTGSVPVLPVVAAAVAAAAIAWLMTVLWLIALMLGAVLVAAAGGLVLVHRYNRRETARFIVRMGALPEAAPKPAIAAGPAAVHYHTHLHVGPGTDAEALIRQAVPQRDTVTITKGDQQ